MLTSSELKQIKDYLALYGKRDGQLEAVPVNLDYPEVTFEANDYLSVVQDSKNKTIKIKDLEKVFLLTFLTDEDFREALKGKIPEEMLENACVTTEKLADGAVTTIKLGTNAVTTAKIADGAVTGEKIANNTIQGAAFAANSITSDKIVDNTVTGDKLADGSIQSVDIKDNTLSGSKFVDGSISGSKIQDNVIESKHLLDNSIPASKIKDGSIESVDIKDGTLDGAKIKDNTIESVKLANNAITTDKIIDNSITASKIANDAITEDKIVDDSITTAKIANSSVTTDKIIDEAVTEDKLANGAVTTAKLADGLISEIQNITDATPTTGSVKPVQSGGVKTAIDNVAFSTNEKVKDVGIDDEPTAGSDNLVESGGVQSVLNKIAITQIFLINRESFYIENNGNTGDVFFTFASNLFLRAGATEKDVTVSELATELGVSLVTSTKGVANCITIGNSRVFCYDYDANAYTIIARANVKRNHIKLICNNSGKATYVVQGLLNTADNKANINTINDTLNYVNIVRFVGNANTYSYTYLPNMIPGHRYRLYLQSTTWDMSEVTVTGVYKLSLGSFVGSTETVLFSVGIASTAKAFYDFTVPTNAERVRVGGRANKGVSVVFSIIDLTTLEEKCDLVPYFASSSVPTFSDVNLNTPTLKIKFPLNSLRLYTAWGKSLFGDYSGAANQTFTIENLQSLVWDFSDSSIKVVASSAAGNYIHLLNLAKNSVTGLFAGWFNEQMRKEIVNSVDGKINALGEEITASKDYAITSGTASFSGLVEVGVPYNRKFIFRVDDPDGTLNYVSSLAGYDYDGNSVSIAPINLQTNTNYVYYAPCALKSLRVWVGSSYMTGTSGTITVSVVVPSQYDDESIVRRWNENDKLTIRDNIAANADLKALFFSDIHGNTSRFERIIELGNDWKDVVDCIIDGGDDTAAYKTQGNLDWYNTRALTSDIPIVRAVGNHDAWTTNYNVWATKQELYEYFTAVAVAQLTAKGATVVQPSDAATAYKNYYYVDFGSVRMIVITSLTGGSYYDSDQATWFASVLEDARTNSKHVVCVNHAPMPLDSSVENIECNWCSWKTRTSDGTIMESSPLTAVDTFIRNGGKFICWLTGHTHIDYVMKYTKTVDNVSKTQFAFTTSCAKGGVNDGVQPTADKRNAAYDLFNMFSVDLTNHFVKIWRIGFNTNAAMQVHNTFVWDYENGDIIAIS